MMKNSFSRRTIVPALLLLVLTSVCTAEQKPTTVAAAPAAPGSAAPAEKSDAKAGEKPAGVSAAPAPGKEEPAAAGGPTITMKVPPMKVSLFSPEHANLPLAVVNGDEITISDLTATLGVMHMGKQEEKTEARINLAEVLDRLINIKLMSQEAVNIGLDQMPEIKSKIEVFEKNNLRELLLRHELKDVKADEKEVERKYREAIKEWKIAPLRFAKKVDAQKFVQAVRKGKKFPELAEKAIKEGKAQGAKESAYKQAQGMQPQIAEAVERMKPGSITPVIPVEKGFAVVKLEEVRFPEDPKAKEEAQKAALIDARQKGLKAYKESLYKKYVKIDTKLLKKIDFEARKPGFKSLQKDKRTIAEIKGEAPVTVADLASAINDKFFHGVATPLKEKKVNILKAELLDQILQKRVVLKEALAQGIDKTDEYKKMVSEFKETITFGVFIEKVIRRDVKVTEEELKAYYQEHANDPEFSYPAMVRMNGLAFTTTEAAQASLGKLRQGVDFKWLKSTAEGQVAEGAPNVLQFTGSIVAMTTLPEDLRKLITGARSGEFKLYADAFGHYYAIHILDMIHQKQKPYEEARETIATQIYGKNLKKVVDEWLKKLREAADIKINADFSAS
jgi:parvulin-like peptidyl-prolyl isomerase